MTAPSPSADTTSSKRWLREKGRDGPVLDRGARALMALLERHAVRVAFHLDEHEEAIGGLLIKYQTVPISLADACLVRMSEIYPRSVELTLDGNFRVYRRHGRQVVPTMMPPAA